MYSVGLIGLPNVGKSTLFNAITKGSVPAENYPFCTIDPSSGVIEVKDERINVLAGLSDSKKSIPAVLKFTDIAGLVRGASQGEGLGNEFLSHIRQVDALLHIVRIFDNPKIIHTEGKTDPLRDIEIILNEIILADLGAVQKRKEKMKKEKGEEAEKERVSLDIIESILKNSELLSEKELGDDEIKFSKKNGLLSIKPMLYVLNYESEKGKIDMELQKKLNEYFQSKLKVEIDAFSEGILSETEESEAEQMRKEMGLTEDGMNNLIVSMYKLLDLITFFTTGEEETRGWTIRRGTKAPLAGSAIHTDFTEKFIRVEVVSYDDFVSSKSYANAREKGLLRTEGKEYIVKDGDILHFKI